MTESRPQATKPLRLWPALALVGIQWGARYALPAVNPEWMQWAVLTWVGLGLVVALWWLFFSRASWLERVGILALSVAGVVGIRPWVDPSIAGGMMGMMLYLYSIPVLSLALVAAAVISRNFAAGPRRLTLAAAVLLGASLFLAIRTDGIDSEANSALHWRWTPTAEQQLLARSDEPVAPRAVPAAQEPAPAAPPPADVPPAAVTPARPPTSSPPDWPGFRGPQRDSVARAARIQTDWAASPPVELWRRKVGPGWSSFAVQGGRIFTQEQRGEFEVVSCYDAATGAPVWIHRDRTRFWESNAGPGPRGTPTLSDGRVYALGATGILNVLDAATGAPVWARNAAKDTGAKTPEWGFSSSPLVLDRAVIVAASGHLAAYGLAKGDLQWTMKTGGGSYSSPHRLMLAGIEQIVLPHGDGIAGVSADGRRLWNHAWDGTPMLQPALTADGGLLVTTAGMGGGAGVRRLAVTQGAQGWTVEEQWTSRGLKPYFNDLVIHQGHAYGFDGGILSCIDLAEGKRKWKGGRYGHGQLLLLPEQDLLLVLSEEGDLALVPATPTEFREAARRKAIEGKTWNHPVLVGTTLWVRNGEEMAAFRLRAE
jgi:outer membrane protein assembly factor BamB